MTNVPIQVPESYLAYCKDRAVQEAVDHILTDKSLHVPADLEWDELPKFYRAVMAARQVPCEYAIFLHELWNAVWKPALGSLRAHTRTIADQKLDPDTLWWDWFDQVLDITDTNLVLRLGVTVPAVDLERPQLRLSLRDTEDNVDPITGLDLGADWPSEDVADGWAQTRLELALIADDGSIDLDALRKAAADALTAVRSRLQD